MANGHPGDPGANPTNNPYKNGGGGGAPNLHGWGGISGLFKALSSGLNATQYGRLQSGYDGLNGAVGNEHGAFAGLSPYAVHFLATSGLLDQAPVQQVSMTDASGNALTGIPLLMAQIQQSINNAAPTKYNLAQGLTQQNLQTVLQAAAANGQIFNKGYGMYGAQGAAAPSGA